MASMTAGNDDTTQPEDEFEEEESEEETRVFEKVEVCLNSSENLKFFSAAHWFLMNTELETVLTHRGLKDTVRLDLQKHLQRDVGVNVHGMDIVLGAAVPADVDNNTGGGNEMAEQDVVKIDIQIADRWIMFKIDGGTRREVTNCLLQLMITNTKEL
eukprot:GHVS01097949.1.p2 GENE.GHVS01097949.1~~GHVS01097949.1.p2  ORF type:complete len:157 (+),score=32.10 GHVS01097949.1:103-573(+)